ncbi:protein TAPETUM DETERMINANT 1-like [Telopea speciosissima]|uniref:protein TAPETUM DETERMINANT 1-like n=1 Tax=Telopea speciosissima TaxID=54955 RepID=UPI001CC53751|nr:protein TAPETUM DETERMINANT 1-like [Telopea speciosissima]
MATTLHLFSSFLLLLFICEQGYGKVCSISDLSVKLKKTGNVIEQKPEYLVTITNNCACPQSKVLMKCFGLSSVEPVDPAICKPVDDINCLINGGKPIQKGHPISFKYAWLTPSDFSIVESNIVCS